MISLLVFIFCIKLYARINTHCYILEKYGQEILNISRKIEKLTIKLEKIKHDLKFLVICKKEKLIPTFARPKLSIHVERKIKVKIAKIIIETEMKNKHRKKNELRTELRSLLSKLEESTNYFICKAIQYRIRSILLDKSKQWDTTHNKKLLGLRPKYITSNGEKLQKTSFITFLLTNYQIKS